MYKLSGKHPMMVKEQEIVRILRQARTLLKSGKFGGPTVRGSGQVGRPVPVLGPTGELHSWFTPVTVGDRIVGFFQFLPDLTMMHYSSFQRHEGSMEGCPPADTWTDAHTIRSRAEWEAGPGEKAGEPFLTFDRAPSRLAWAVMLTSPEGTTRKIYIAGETVWEGGPAGHSDSFGGSRDSD